MMRFANFVLGLMLTTVSASHLIAQQPLRNALTMDAVNWEQCVALVDGKEQPPPSRELLAAWLGIDDAPATPTRWSTGPAAGEMRHFRVVFKEPIAVGTVCSPAEQIAVLRDDAKLPGDITDDKQWHTLPGRQVRTLAAGIKVRALRVTLRHNNLPWEAAKKVSEFPGVWLLSERYYSPSELGTQRWASTANSKPAAAFTWLAYWPEPLLIEGCVVAQAGVPATSLAALPADSKLHPRTAPDEQWQSVNVHSSPALISLNRPTSTQAIRLSLPTAAVTKGQLPPSVYALVKLAGDAAEISASSHSFVPPAPVAVQYDMPMDGFIALRIEDSTGRHVRRLIAEVERTKGIVNEGWDLLDDQGRTVPPGKYRFAGVARPPLKLTYEMTVYNAGQPPWMAPVPGGGWWMADHAPPTSVCAVGETMFFGAAGAEFGAPLIATDREGRKLWHDLHQGAQRLVSDGRYAYVVNDQEVVRIDPQASFAKQSLHKFAYSADLP
ncbi:MAG TPA: hypothetical protein VL096_00355 [Pirellulaceae bacterium]|nr:hypothetical protein [Pirellulaceae bacterium]